MAGYTQAEKKGVGMSTSSTEAITSRSDPPLYVVTAEASGEVSGCLAGFVTQASISPFRFLVCISKVNHTFRIAERSKGLALHLLGADQRALAAVFGTETGDVVDKFSQVAWRAGLTGAPVLSECAAWVEGSIINRMSGGDHEAFLITVTDGGAGAMHGTFRQGDAAGFVPGHPA
jgi:flavin reductase (DIM6/NTAB) family NADH-FMN oxidoreductase RutF